MKRREKMRENKIIFDFPCSETFREHEAELNDKKQVIIHQVKKAKPLNEIEFRKAIEKLKRLKNRRKGIILCRLQHRRKGAWNCIKI